MASKRHFVLTFVVACVAVTAPEQAAATMTWDIPDGDPDYWMSDAIVVRSSAVGFFDRFAPNPPELVWQDPIAGQTNDVWVRVTRFGALNAAPDDTQTGKVRLFIGSAGVLFEAANYDGYDPGFFAHLLEPSEMPVWTQAEWAANLVGSAVVPVRHQVSTNNWVLEYVLDKDSTFLPNDGECRWLLFEIEPHRLPFTTGAGDLPISLVAYIYDPDSYPGGDVTTNDAMAERRFNVLEVDMGDAPDPTYPTLSANDGPRHIATGPMLGTLRDTEREGQPTATADGDDGNDTDDDDGVVLTSFMVPGATASLDVIASESALLNAWVDFNEDGDWEDAGEQIFVDQAVFAGSNSLNFDVPEDAPTDLIGLYVVKRVRT